MKTKMLFISLTLGLGLTLALLGLLGVQAKVVLAQAGTGIIRVALTGSDTPGCGSEANPCRTVQYAVDQAQVGDEIHVASGVYTGVQNVPSLNTGTFTATQVVVITKTLTLCGGYTATNWTTPAPEANPTKLDAQGDGRVFYITGDISPTIEGLRITGGDADGLGGDTSPEGQKEDAGGGVYVITATAAISRNQVFSNTANHGGGLFLYRSTATLSDNEIISNTAGQGGGVFLDRSTATLSDNEIISNTAGQGGGLYLHTSTATLIGDTILSNTANISGGGLRLADHSTATLSGVTITANIAITAGGGLYLRNVCNAILTNTIIADNRLITGTGAGLHIEGSSAHLVHTTIARNSGGDGSGVYVTEYITGGKKYTSTVALTNTILVSHTVGITVTTGNTATLEATLWGTDTWRNETNWGDAGHITTGTHNYWGDPAFVNPDVGDYRIGLGSAAIDVGVPAGVTVDIDGESREKWPPADLGAHEFVPDLSVAKEADPDLVQAGAQLTYTIRITNTGNVDLHATVTDTLPAQVTTTQPVTWTAVITAPGSVWTEQVFGTVKMGYSGTLTNVAEVTTDEGAMGVYTETSTSLKPATAVDKKPSVDTARVGETITYTYTVTNTGGVPLNVSASDNRLTDFSLSTTLEPGDIATGIATYTVQESDLPGPLVNTVTVTGTSLVGYPVTDTHSVSVVLTSTPGIEMAKKSSVTTASVGETIAYTYTVTNTGDVTLTDIRASDNRLGAINNLVTDTLAPGETTSGTATHTVQWGDLCLPDRQLVNTVTVTGTSPAGDVVTDTDDASVKLRLCPNLPVFGVILLAFLSVVLKRKK